MFKLMYNGVEVPNFVRVTGIDQYLLPEIDNITLKSLQAMVIQMWYQLMVQRFYCALMIIFDGEHRDSYLCKMAAWLMGNNR